MIKKFSELSKVEVPITKKPTFKFDKAKQKVVKDGELDTLSWVDCLTTLYENGAEKVTFENIPNENGSLLYKDDNGAIHIKLYVDIDGDRREIFYPVIDGTNDVAIGKLTQSDIYNAKQRGFVKCVAVNWGLGINLWKKDIDPDSTVKSEEQSMSESFRALVNSATKKCGGVKEMLSHLNGVGEKDIKKYIADLQTIDGIVKVLTKVLGDDKESGQE